MFSVPPLFVIEFLHRVVDTFTEYFNSCNETSIKEHVVVVFEVRMNYDDEDTRPMSLGDMQANTKSQ